jgi:O-antigen/teichoic acid export membrane protein
MISKEVAATHQGLSLRANFSWTFIGNAVYAASQWGMVVILAKLGSPEMVGQFALGLAITAPVMMFANMQLRGIQATDAKKEFEFGHYFGLRLITIGLALLCILLLLAILNYSQQMMLVILAVGLAKSVEAVSDVFYGLLQKYERMDWIAKSMMIKGPLSLLALGLGVHLTNTVFWGVVGMVIVWSCVLFGYDLRSGIRVVGSSNIYENFGKLSGGQIEKIYPQWHWAELGQLTKMALPLGIVMLFLSINPNLPRYFIEYYWGEYELGIFAAMAYLMVVGGMVINALGQSASPRLARLYADTQLLAFKKLLFMMVVIGIVIAGLGVFVAVMFGQEILTILYQPEYARQDVFVLLMLAAGIGYVGSFLGYAMTAARYFHVQLPLFASAAAITAVASFLLIPRIGLPGAALALICGAIVQVIGSSLILRYALSTGAFRESYDNV